MTKRSLDGIGMTSMRTRRRLVERLQSDGIDDVRVLDAIERTPRHFFVDEALASRAYEDTALPIGYNQTISQPYIVAAMTQVLIHDLEPKKLLEIGTGSGYQTAILARIAEKVYSIERVAALIRRAMDRLYRSGIRNVHYHEGDGSKGWIDHSPYDGILVTAAPKSVPVPLLQQLDIGGKMVIPVGTRNQQKLLVIERTDDAYVETEHEWVNFVPLIEGKG
ncbi:MAG: protein-L-isoaspartate(D-aspartate) O-methyltransferase [Gammaproteobacteria bacterium]|nr:protein-L-isoaspartate(D-aspartate) O-methyltransferase [Gammaproteobacteria bacterium]